VYLTEVNDELMYYHIKNISIPAFLTKDTDALLSVQLVKAYRRTMTTCQSMESMMLKVHTSLP
jgi:hypothetical protein